MNRRGIAAIIVGAAAAGVIGGALLWDSGVEATKRAMLATEHSCPAGTLEKFERAGEIGWLRLCVKGAVRHGPFAYWKSGRKHAEGAYEEGRHAGAVRYFDEGGNVVKVEHAPQ